MSNYQENYDILNDFIDLSAKQNLLTEMILSVIEEIKKNPQINLNDALVSACIEVGIEPDEEDTTENLLNINDNVELDFLEHTLEDELNDEADRLDRLDRLDLLEESEKDYTEFEDIK
jgi:hypothetical protein